MDPLSGSSVRRGKSWNFHASAKLRRPTKATAKAATLLLKPAVYAADKLGCEGGNRNGRKKTPIAANIPTVKANAATRSRVLCGIGGVKTCVATVFTFSDRSAETLLGEDLRQANRAWGRFGREKKDREPVTSTCYESVVEGTEGYVDVRFSPTDCGERSYQRVACRLARLWLGWRTTNVLNSFARYFGRAVSVCLCRVCSVLCPPLCAYGGSPRLANVSMRLCTSCRHHVVHMGCQQGGRVDDHAL